jgi:hypothetical protein
MSYGVKIRAGTVTLWQDAPIATREEAERCAEAIEKLTGEKGVVVSVATIEASA